ncbi:1,4-dihydroxy-2-naphthoate octaprenyltransferase [Aquimarina litoralis]|uniref:1,4-dihydroxy-2-naphthoate octaprenyltransferase n=1 Tax=Aquimarina litoralis TaxID=584605 RepID=UPI001C59E562|nr:1,4-dihydroxy-2-naphthoate octaprenyltransferase [Aquimarina litoralis]MBW1297628.1 1,4-dihydroxy-2-naphthoate octaprenyltransferase [Aquimarina litoralis]
MANLKAWISAARLRTLPLSISGIIVGSSMFNNEIVNINISSEFKMGLGGELSLFLETSIFWLAIATTLGLQILSNFANDYGDGVKGTDNDDRVGPQRALQSGAITKNEMFRGIVITSIITLLLAIYLIYVSFGQAYFFYSIFFLLLGIAAIIAAIKYTMGNTAYGYKGLGDVFVFIFFGLVSVVGCYFLFTKHLNCLVFLPAITIGLLSSAVLNLNNLRDHDSDKKVGKNTLVVKLGIHNAKKYHYFLLLGAMSSMMIFLLFTYQNYDDLLFLVAFIPLFIHFFKVIKTKNTKDLDPELKKVALSTFLLAILFSLGQIL